MRRIPVPPHRFTPLKANWEKVVTTIVVLIFLIKENMKLQVRMNL
jgi:RNA-binding protein PNO1